MSWLIYGKTIGFFFSKIPLHDQKYENMKVNDETPTPDKYFYSECSAEIKEFEKTWKEWAVFKLELPFHSRLFSRFSEEFVNSNSCFLFVKSISKNHFWVELIRSSNCKNNYSFTFLILYQNMIKNFFINLFQITTKHKS